MKNLSIIFATLLLASCTVEPVPTTTLTEDIEPPTHIEVVQAPFAVPEWLQGEFKSFIFPNNNLMTATQDEIYIDLRQNVQPSFSGEYIINESTLIGGEEQPDYFAMEVEDIVITFYKTTNQDIQVRVWQNGQEYNLSMYIKQ